MPQRMKCFDIDFHIDHKLHILRTLPYYNRIKDWNEVRRVPAESAFTDENREINVSPGTIWKRHCCTSSAHPGAWRRRYIRPWRWALSEQCKPGEAPGPEVPAVPLLGCLPLPQHPSSAGTYVPFLNPWLPKNPPPPISVDSFKHLRVMGQVNGIEGGWMTVFSTQTSTCSLMFSWLLGSR